MNILKVEIYGYGKIIQQTLVLNQGLTAVYGLNEAGKTTWMDFIRHVLFGFPTKKGNARQYLPKKGGVCGGCLYLDTRRYGKVKIERILTAQRVTGEACVFLSNGEERDETFITELLDTMTEQTFQSVFHFGLDGLQEMHQKRDEDISEFLFATAVFGEKTGKQFMAHREREMKQLFRVRGKSRIGQGLEDLALAYADLQAWKQKEQNYRFLLKERELLLVQSQEQKLAMKRSQAALERTKQLLAVQPTVRAYQAVKNQIEELAREPFVAEDIRNYLKEKLQEKEAIQQEIQRVTDDLNLLAYQMKDAKSDYFFHLQATPFKEDVASLKEMALALTSYEERLKENKRKLQNLYQFLGEEVDKEFLQALPNQFLMREQLKQLVQEYESLTEEIRSEQMRLSAFEAELDEKQHAIRSLQDVPAEDLSVLRKELELRYQVDEWERNLAHLYAQRTAHKGAQSREQGRQKKTQSSSVQLLLWTGCFLLVAITFCIGWLQGNWLTVGLASGLTALFLIQILQRKHTASNQAMEEYLAMQIKGLELQLAEAGKQMPRSELELTEMIAEIEEKRAELLAERKTMASLQQNWQREHEAMVQRKHTQQKLRAQVEEILQGIWLPLEKISSTWIAYLDGCFALKQCMREREQLQNRHAEAEKQYQACLSYWGKQFSAFSQSKGSFEMLVRDWELQKSKLERKHAQDEQIAQQYLDYALKRKDLCKQREEILGQLNSAYIHTPFQEEADFIAENARWELYTHAREKEEQLRAQLSYFIERDEEDLNDFTIFDSLEENQVQLLYQLEADEQDLEQVQKQLQLIAHQIYEIETGIDKLQHQSAYDYKKGLLAEDIHEWLVLTQMVDQFQAVMDVFRTEKMPRLLERVSQYFKEMTGGSYEKVEICADIQAFIVQNREEIRFEVQELSRGTKEQLYTALRFAMAEVSPFQVKMPFVIDDSFVNFDQERLEQVLHVLKNLSAHVQVIYFTCHADVHSFIENLTDVIQPKIS